jgi:hypothetical protein
VTIEVTPKAVAVLTRALEAGRMDPARVAIRLTLGRGPGGEEVRTGFADEAEPDEVSVAVGGITLYVPGELVARGATVDVSDEHDRIVVR